MNREQASRIIGQIGDKHIEEAGRFALARGSAPAKPRRLLRWGAAAACLVLILALGSTVLAYRAEARAYREAIAFFAENGLSAEGLSRTEVKAVYRDISTRKLTCSRTAEVIRQLVPGWEIRQSVPGPEELSALREQREETEARPTAGITYRKDYRYARHEQAVDTLEASILECLRDGEVLWTAEFTHFYLDGCAGFPEGTVVWGWNETFSSGDTVWAWIACVDGEGNILWERPLSHGFRHENIAAVLRSEDGAWAVVSRGDMKYLCLSCLDPEGQELSFCKTEVGNYGIWNAARLGEGYIIQLGSSNTGEYARLVRMDREGGLIGDYSYAGEDCVYHITDMAEFRGRVYLSAYAVPIQHDEGGRDEIGNILDYIIRQKNWAVTEEELTPLVRDNYTAVLLLCDPEGGVPETFYSVPGSLGGELNVQDPDRLEWSVESVASAYFSPATSSFSIGGACRVFRYAFDGAGSLTGQTDTCETVPYYR